jgi:hypothetical protein
MDDLGSQHPIDPLTPVQEIELLFHGFFCLVVQSIQVLRRLPCGLGKCPLRRREDACDFLGNIGRRGTASQPNKAARTRNPEGSNEDPERTQDVAQARCKIRGNLAKQDRGPIPPINPSKERSSLNGHEQNGLLRLFNCLGRQKTRKSPCQVPKRLPRRCVETLWRRILSPLDLIQTLIQIDDLRSPGHPSEKALELQENGAGDGRSPGVHVLGLL